MKTGMAYRSEEEALRVRVEHLETELSNLRVEFVKHTTRKGGMDPLPTSASIDLWRPWRTLLWSSLQPTGQGELSSFLTALWLFITVPGLIAFCVALTRAPLGVSFTVGGAIAIVNLLVSLRWWAVSAMRLDDIDSWVEWKGRFRL